MSDANPIDATGPQRPRSPVGRRVVASVAVTLVLALIARDGAVIQAAVFAVPDVSLPDVSCGSGITRLRAEYAPLWGAVREGGRAPSLAALDLQLRALRPRCVREGEATLARFTRLERWRYRAEAQARLWNDTLSNDRALAEP